jgi:hypothetical protein
MKIIIKNGFIFACKEASIFNDRRLKKKKLKLKKEVNFLSSQMPSGNFYSQKSNRY